MNKPVVSMFVCVLLTAADLRAQEYQIKLTRGDEVGNKYDVVLTGATRNHMLLATGDEILQDQKEAYSVKLVGEQQVVAVDKTKQATKITIKVQSATVTQRGKTTDLLKKDDVIVAWHEGDDLKITVNGTEADEDVDKYLNTMVSVHQEGAPSDDDIFGTNEKKKVGDKWNINSELAAKDLLTRDIKVRKENISGEVCLKEIVKKDGIECLKVEADLKITGFTPPLPVIVKGMKSNLSCKFSGLFPTDLKMNALTSESSLLITVSGTVGMGAPGEESATARISMESSMTVSEEARRKK